MDVRRPTDADFAAVLALVQAYDRSVIGDTDWTEEELREEWRTLDRSRDAWLIELDGRAAGYATFENRGDGRMMGDGYVDPALAGRGVGGTILRLTEERARQEAATVEPGRRVTLQNATLLAADGDAAHTLYESHGYQPVRHFWRMVIDLDTEPRVPGSLDGVTIDSYDAARDDRPVHAAIQEAFEDHWQHRQVPWEQWEEQWRTRGVDRTLWWVARAGDDVAGALLASWKRSGDWGFVDILGVRRPWRGRGVGEALLRTAFAELRRRGEQRVALGVDAESPTGATRLYERVGMRIFWRAVVWEKELRGGA